MDLASVEAVVRPMTHPYDGHLSARRKPEPALRCVTIGSRQNNAVLRFVSPVDGRRSLRLFIDTASGAEFLPAHADRLRRRQGVEDLEDEISSRSREARISREFP